MRYLYEVSWKEDGRSFTEDVDEQENLGEKVERLFLYNNASEVTITQREEDIEDVEYETSDNEPE